MLLAARALQAGNAALSIDVNGQPYTGAFSKTVTGDELVATRLSSPTPARGRSRRC